MIPTNRIPTHPGEMLLEEFLKPKGISQVRFADYLGIPLQRVNEVVNGKRGVTPETALLFGAALGTSPQLWMNLQAAHDLALARARLPRVPAAFPASGVGTARRYPQFRAAKRFAARLKKRK